MALSYEKEQEKLLKLYDEVMTDNSPEFDDSISDDSFEEDHCEIQDINTDSEQEIEDVDVPADFDNLHNVHVRIPSFVTRNFTKWKKHAPANKRVRTRANNIIVNLPGVKKTAIHLLSASEIWNCFFTDEILETIVKHTNTFIEIKNTEPTNRTARPTDILELKAFIGLLYIAGKEKHSRLNASDLFRTDGMSLEIYRLTMSFARFQFLLSHIRFDDKRSREERQKVDRLAPVRDLFESVNSNWPKYFSLSEYTTVDEMLPAFRGIHA